MIFHLISDFTPVKNIIIWLSCLFILIKAEIPVIGGGSRDKSTSLSQITSILLNELYKFLSADVIDGNETWSRYQDKDS